MFRFGKTALHFAIEHEHTRMVEFILRQPHIQVDIKVLWTWSILPQYGYLMYLHLCFFRYLAPTRGSIPAKLNF